LTNSTLEAREASTADFSTLEVKPTQSPAISTPEVREMHPATLTARIVTLIVVLVPFLGFVAAAVLLWGYALTWPHLLLMAGMYLATGLGITVGYHRLFTHRAFNAPAPVRAVLGILGSMAVQGPILQWASNHRRHHQHADKPSDPHSPHAHGEGVKAALTGFWHSHIGWLFDGTSFSGVARYVPDLQADPVTRRVSDLFPLWVLIGLIIPSVIGGLITMSWSGVLMGFLWGGLARVFLVHHVTWSVNSICHLWGTRPFRSHDESRNNAIVGVLALGEGWHNNHHAFPTSARHGLRWWQFDISYIVIKSLVLLGLASEVRVPSPERMAEKRA